MRDIRRLLVHACWIVLLGGCAATGGAVRPDGMTLRTSPDPLIGMQSYTGDDVLRVAEEAFDQALYARAYALYMRYVDEFPGTSREPFALFNGGLSAERAGLHAQAIKAYERFLGLSRDDEQRTTARFRLVACTLADGRWDDARGHIERLLDRPDTALVDRYELRAQRAWADANRGDPEGAEEALRIQARRYRRDRGRTLGAWQGAMVNFYLGETCRLQAEEVEVTIVDDLDRARAELNHKAEHILDAQEAYLETIRIGVHQWIPRAGYGLGGLYTTFRCDIIEAPYPTVVRSESDREIYAEILDEETAVLLLKTRMVYEKVLTKAAEFEFNDEAVAMIRESLARVQRELETQGLAAEI